MDSLELLAREDEFKKLNKQLEKKTESLMKQIEHAMQKQDFFSEFSSKRLSLTPTNSAKKHLCGQPQLSLTSTPMKTLRKERKKATVDKVVLDNVSSTNCEDPVNPETGTENPIRCECCTASKSRLSGDEEFMRAFVSVSVQEKVLPPSFMKDAVSVESICKFLSSKVRLLEEQIELMQTSIDKKAKQCKIHLTHQAELEGERLVLLNKNSNLQSTAADCRAKCAAMELKLNEKDRLYKEQRSECDRLSCELKRLKCEYANVCSRHAGQVDAISTLTQQLKNAKAEHMDFRDSTRSLSASNQAAILTLEKKIKVSNLTIDKQSALIDNLRKQNAILRTEAAMRALEKEYNSFLNQDL